jgi:hypothetical protein
MVLVGLITTHNVCNGKFGGSESVHFDEAIHWHLAMGTNKKNGGDAELAC